MKMTTPIRPSLTRQARSRQRQRPASLAHAAGSEGRAVIKLAKRKALMLLTLTATYGDDTMALTTEGRTVCSHEILITLR